MSGQHCENYDVKQETVHYYLRNVVFHRFDPFALLYNKSLNDWSRGEQRILFPENLNVPETKSRETLRFEGNKIHCSPRDQSLSVDCYPSQCTHHVSLLL